MPAVFRKRIRQLDAEYAALSQGYDVESLHQFRVALRHLRSLLRHNTSGEVRHLRCQLGKLARPTNPARDWDTLLIRARASLSARDFAQVQPCLEARRAESHQPVLDMLRSERWPKIRRELKKIIKVHGPSLAVDLHGDAELSRAKRRVRRAWRAVQSRDGNEASNHRAWHKLRIAIKDLRYRLETVPKHSRTPSITTILKVCKQLQESLGVWHDSVVHVGLVQKLCEDASVQAQQELPGILDTWCQRMQREAQDALASASAELAAEGAEILG